MIIIDTNHPITNAALEKWKLDTQMDILQEESGEVVTAVSRWERGRVGKEKVAEEVADVIVSMMSVIPGLDIEDMVESYIRSKLTRLKGRIEDDI
jgi:NTP pyrophosphatase (non-canonical NTP hydrolase)